MHVDCSWNGASDAALEECDYEIAATGDQVMALEERDCEIAATRGSDDA